MFKKGKEFDNKSLEIIIPRNFKGDKEKLKELQKWAKDYAKSLNADIEVDFFTF